MANQHQLLVTEQEALASAESRIQVLEDRLRVTDAAMTDAGQDTGPSGPSSANTPAARPTAAAAATPPRRSRCRSSLSRAGTRPVPRLLLRLPAAART